MQSSMAVAGMDALSDPAKTFDTSGKSPALFKHRAICKTPMALPDNGLFGAIAGQKSLPTIRSCTGSPRRMIACEPVQLLIVGKDIWPAIAPNSPLSGRAMG